MIWRRRDPRLREINNRMRKDELKTTRDQRWYDKNGGIKNDKTKEGKENSVNVLTIPLMRIDYLE